MGRADGGEQDCILPRRQPAHCTAKPAIRGALPHTPASDKEQDEGHWLETVLPETLSDAIETPPAMSCPLGGVLEFIVLREDVPNREMTRGAMKTVRDSARRCSVWITAQKTRFVRVFHIA